VCEIATVTNLSAGIGDGILQKLKTWLQCRQQVAMDLSRGNLQLRFQSRVPTGTSGDTCDEVESTKQLRQLRQEKQR
jgi:hypothetical protein